MVAREGKGKVTLRALARPPAPAPVTPGACLRSGTRRPAPAGSPLACPDPCASSPFASADAHHDKPFPTPPNSPTPDSAAPNCATELKGERAGKKRAAVIRG